MIARAKDTRLAPLEPPYDPAIARTLERMMGGMGAEPLKLFRTVAHNPHLLDKLRSTGSYLLNFGTLEPADRELVILRTCARCGSEYEWGVHVAIFSEAAALDAQTVAATAAAEPGDPVWSDRQRALVSLVDQLNDAASVTDDLWQELAAGWTPAQLVELATLVGQYHTVSFLTNAFAIELEDFGTRFPSRDAGGASP